MIDLNRLNKEQQIAARHIDGPLLILAGAGSGKTSTMTHRIAYMIEDKQIPPYNILAVTFTNKAAGEMRERVGDLLGREPNMWILTFHATCLRILRKYGHLLGYTNSFIVYDPVDTKSVVKTILKDLNYDEKQFTVNGMLAAISDCKEKELTPDGYKEAFGGGFRSDRIYQIYKSYESVLKKNNAMDFDDLLLNTVRLLRKEPEVLEHYRQRFKYIMVDEYQDTNKVQYSFLKLLAKTHSNICVVGDDDQCIYQWRGADISNIINFEHDFKGAKVIKLEQNYRSTANILDAAHSVIKNNRQRKAKKLWTSMESGNKIVYRRADDEKEEAYYISQQIRALSGSDENYKDFAILYRNNAQSRNFEEALSVANIPYRVVGGTRYYDRKEIKDIVAYMRLVENPKDDLAMLRVINQPKRGIGPTTVDRLRIMAIDAGESIFDTLMDMDVLASLTAKPRQKIGELMVCLSRLHDERENMNVSDVYDSLLNGTGYMAALEEAGTVEADGRLENLLEFKSVILEYEKEGQLSMADFLEKIALLSDVDNHQPSENAVVLMTMHSAKGLEFPVVFLPGMEDGLFPSWRSMEDGNRLEEERRLCYVGMTRAKERLFLTGASYRVLYGKGDSTRESTFLRELNPKLLDGDGVYQKKNEVRLGETKSFDGYASSQPYTPYNTVAAAKKQIKEMAKKETFMAGDKVSHSKFGQGLVLEVKGNVATIMFDQAGRKRLDTDVAPLKKV